MIYVYFISTLIPLLLLNNDNILIFSSIYCVINIIWGSVFVKYPNRLKVKKKIGIIIILWGILFMVLSIIGKIFIIK